MRREVARVGVEVDDELARGDGERAPHRVALAEHRPELGQQLGLLVHVGAQRRRRSRPCRPRRRRRPRAPGRSGRSSDSSRSTIGPIVSATSRVGRTTVTGSRLRSRSSSSGKLRVVEGADQAARTMASREPSPARDPLGRRARDRGRGRARRDRRARRRARASTTPLPDDLHPALLRGARGRRDRGALVPPGRGARGARRGHTIVTTGTASGKSLAFNLPVLDTLAARPARRARSTSTRPRRSPRTRRASSPELGGALPAPRDLRRRHAARGAARDPRSART